MADVFISYKRLQHERVRLIAELLRAEQLDVWFDARLEVGRGEGFDAEIDREVTSAACVLVCWTPEAVRSIYVKAESKKGLDRDVLVPVFLEPCTLPVPFNAIDAADLMGWTGDTLDPKWIALLEHVKKTVAQSKADDLQRAAHSAAEYERVDQKIYPGTLKLLIGRLVAKHDRDAWDYHSDIQAVFEWLESISKKEAILNARGYELADRQSGGSAWYWWENGAAAARSSKLAELREALHRIEVAMADSQKYLAQVRRR
jgi:hypothetical protein